jgi:hypothetical protein
MTASSLIDTIVRAAADGDADYQEFLLHVYIRPREATILQWIEAVRAYDPTALVGVPVGLVEAIWETTSARSFI